MSSAIRKPFLFLALVFVGLAVLMEIGGAFFLDVPAPSPGIAGKLDGLTDAEASELQQRLVEARAPRDRPPGYAIACMAYVDGLFFLTVALFALPTVVGDPLHARTQGVIGLVAGVLVLIATFKKLFVLIIELTIRLTLFLAAPFGTIAYMAIYGAFDRSGAAVVLGLVLFLKLAAGICLVAAHQAFLKQIGLLLMFATAIIASIVTAILHGIVPIFLVAITDTIAALIADILALVWALVFVIFGVIGVIKAIRGGTRQQR